MDWDLKAISWDFAQLERESEQNMTPLIGSSSLGNLQKNKGDCSVDLKLGGLGDFGEVSMNKWKDSRVTVVSSPLTAMKRARVSSGNGVQTISCSVDGCKSDLSKCRDYHRRHKVCEVHSKTPEVMVGGQEKRFCQQCSRFHLLVEFDEVKRSCRKRLDGHNRRRRKPQPEPLSMNPGSLFSYSQGTRLLPFANPQVFTSTNATNPSWHGVVKIKEESRIKGNHLSLHYVDKQNPFHGSFSRTHKGGKQYPFLQTNEFSNRVVPEVSVCQPLINNVASSENVHTDQKMFSDGLTQVVYSDCALSLLSSPSTQQSTGISLSHVVQPESIPMSQPFVSDEPYNNDLGKYQESQQGVDSETIGSVIVSHSPDADLNCQGMFHMGPKGSFQNGLYQTLPFCWD